MTPPPSSIPFGRPQIDEHELAEVTRILESGILVHGTATPAFEQRFAERIGAAHAIAVSSCTAGMHLVLFCKGIGPGDKVAVPAMTHVATAHVVELCGAEPVFVDVARDSGNINPDGVAAVADDLAAAMVVHYLGLPANMDAISAVAARAGFPVIEDCALAVDAKYGEAKAGTIGLAGSFSFYPVKHMTTIEGGIVTTNDDTLAREIASRRAFGYDRTLGARQKPGIYDVDALGFNYRMSEVEAAVGLAQIDKLDYFQDVRARNYALLKAALDEVEELTIFEPVQGKARSSHYCLNAVLPENGSIPRDAVVAHLRENGIGTSVHYPSAVPLFTYYKLKYGYDSGQFPVAEWLAAQTISLPVGPHVSEEDAERIGETMKQAIRLAKTS